MSSELASASAAHARAVRAKSPEAIKAAKRQLEEAKVRAWVAKTLATATPHLSRKTVSLLSRLLTVGGEGK